MKAFRSLGIPLALLLGALLACKSSGSSGSSAASGSAAPGEAPAAPAVDKFVTKLELGTKVEDLEVEAPTTKFSKDVPEIFGVCVISSGSGPLTAIRTKWIAVDVGSAAPPNTLIATHDIDAAKVASFGAKFPVTTDFSLTRPTKGWPVGSYRAEIELNGKLADSLAFTIE